MSAFATTLDAMLKNRSMTQSHLAKFASISQAQISEYVNDESRPDTARLSRICQAFEEEASLLLIAFLIDEIPPEMGHLISIGSPPAAGQTKAPPLFPAAYERLPKRTRALIDAIIEEAERSPKLIRALESTVDLFRGR